MKWLRKWAYPLLFLCSGLVYFVCVDQGQIYEGFLQNLRGWYEGTGDDGEGGQKAVADAVLGGTRILGKTIESGSGQGAFWPESPEGKDKGTLNRAIRRRAPLRRGPAKAVRRRATFRRAMARAAQKEPERTPVRSPGNRSPWNI